MKLPLFDDESDRRAARGVASVLAFAFDVAPERFFLQTRGSPAEAAARQLLLAILRRCVGDMTIKRLSAAISRDRSTVSHALEKIESACDEDPELDAFVDELAALAGRLIILSGQTVASLERLSAPSGGPGQKY